MKTIDHAARAAELVTPAGVLSGIDSIAEKRIAVAQVHATLALVEQQKRIADTLEHVLVAGFDGLVVEVRS